MVSAPYEILFDIFFITRLDYQPLFGKWARARPPNRRVSFNAIRDLKIRERRRQWKRRWKSEFAFLQSSSRLLQITNFVKCRRTLLKLNSYQRYLSSERERKFRCRLCTSSVHRGIRHFHVVFVQWRQRNVQKKRDVRAKLLFWLLNLLLLRRSRCRRRRRILRSLLSITSNQIESSLLHNSSGAFCVLVG